MQLVTDQSDASRMINFDGSEHNYDFSELKSPVANMNDNSYVNALIDEVEDEDPPQLE